MFDCLIDEDSVLINNFQALIKQYHAGFPLWESLSESLATVFNVCLLLDNVSRHWILAANNLCLPKKSLDHLELQAGNL